MKPSTLTFLTIAAGLGVLVALKFVRSPLQRAQTPAMPQLAMPAAQNTPITESAYFQTPAGHMPAQGGQWGGDGSDPEVISLQ